MKRRDLLAYLYSFGCVLEREGSNHSWWTNPANNRNAAIPRHREIGKGLAAKICKQLGVPPP